MSTGGGRLDRARVEPLGERDPRRIGSFVLIGRLGSGGMGTVYQARSPSGRLVAVKTVHGHLAEDPRFRERFAREVDAARRVNGFYTAEVVDADAHAPVPWMATRFIDGPSLAEQVRRHGALPPSEVLVVAAGIGEALICIHAEGLVHRDLKPSNVILASEGLQVIDFGIVHLDEGTGLTSTGSLLGTFEYISPEQAAGEPVTAAADVFSLGGVLHFAATGSPAFGTGHPWELLHRVHSTQPDLSRVTDPALRDLVARCLAKDPQARPTPREVVERCAAAPAPPPGPGTAQPLVSPGSTAGADGTPRNGDAPARSPGRAAPSRRAVLVGGALAAGGGVATAATVLLTRQPSRGGTPQLIRTIDAQRRGVHAVAFTPDGAGFAVAETSRLVGIWRTADAKAIRQLTGHTRPVLAVAWSPDGRRLATGGEDDTVRLWDPAIGACVATYTGHTQWVTGLAFSPAGTTLASVSRDFSLRTWDVASGDSPYTVEGHRLWMSAVAYAPDGAHLTTASGDGTAKIRAVATGAVLRTLTGHDGPVNAITHAPDGTSVATAGDDGTVRIWRTADGHGQHTLTGHVGGVNALAYAPVGATVVSAGQDGTIRWWNAATGGLTRTIAEDGAGGATGVAFSADGTRLLTGTSNGTVRVRDAATGNVLVTRPAAFGSGAQVAFAPDGTTVASCGSDRLVRLWDARTGALRHTLAGHTAALYDVCFAPDGRTVASAGDDVSVRVWDVATGRPLRTLRPPIGNNYEDVPPAEQEVFLTGVYRVAFTPDGRWLLSCGSRGLQAWDPVSGRLVRSQRVVGGMMGALAVRADGAAAAIGNRDGTVLLWSPSDGRAGPKLSGHSDRVETIAYSRDSTLLASGGEDSVVLLRDAATGLIRRRLTGHTGLVSCAAFLAGSTVLATAAEDGVRLWDVATGAGVEWRTGHDGPVVGMATSGDDRTLATIGGVDGRVRLWDVAAVRAPRH